VLEETDTEKMSSTALNGYHLFSIDAEYGGVKQRWIVVFSEKAFVRETKTLEKKIEQEKEKVEKAVWHFSNQEFYNEEDGVKAARKKEKRWNYHRISSIEFVERKKKKDEEALRAYKEQQYTAKYRFKQRSNK
jgi:transposase